MELEIKRRCRWRMATFTAWKSENTRIFGLLLSCFCCGCRFLNGVLGVMLTWYKTDCRTSCSSATMEMESGTSFYVLLVVESYIHCKYIFMYMYYSSVASWSDIFYLSSDVISLKIYSDWLWQMQSTFHNIILVHIIFYFRAVYFQCQIWQR